MIRRTPAPLAAVASLAALAALAALLAAPAGAQDSTATAPEPRLGLAAVGLYAIDAGLAHVLWADEGRLLAGALDLGRLGPPSVRLVAEVSYLTALTERRDPRDPGATRTRPRFFDLTVGASVQRLFARRGRVEPYVGAGAALHALSASSGIVPIDTRYNVNEFGLHASLGAIIAIDRSGESGLHLELRGVGARNVSRVELRAGYARYLGQRIPTTGVR